MNYAFAGQILALTVSVIGNLSLAGLFLSSAFDPSRFSLPKDFGMIIFVFEFLNVHSTAMAHGMGKTAYSFLNFRPSEAALRAVKGNSGYVVKVKTSPGFGFLKKNPKLAVIGFYLLGAIGMGIGFKSWILPAYFAVGIIAKFFGRKATHDDRGIVYLILLLLFSFVLGMRIWIGVIFFLFILGAGIFAVGRPNLPQPQLFQAKLDLLTYAMPLIIFVPLYFLSSINGPGIGGEIMWALLYFPWLAVNDVAIFVKSRFGAEANPLPDTT